MKEYADKTRNAAASVFGTIDVTVAHASAFLEQTNTINSKSDLQSSYYSFSVKLIRVIEQIDCITNDISKLIIAFDRSNDLAGVVYANSLFDLLVSLRKVLQEFLEHGEKILKAEEPPFLFSSIKKETDILMRKIILAKDGFKKYL